MVIQQIKQDHWNHVYGQITRYGKGAPLSLQYDVEVNCNGVHYLLRVQPDRKCRLAALQALVAYPGDGGIGGEEYHLVKENAVLSALLVLIVSQGAEKRGA